MQTKQKQRTGTDKQSIYTVQKKVKQKSNQNAERVKVCPPSFLFLQYIPITGILDFICEVQSVINNLLHRIDTI